MRRLGNKPSLHSCDTIQGFGLGWYYAMKRRLLFVFPILCMLLVMPLEAASLPFTSGDDVIEEETNESLDDTNTSVDGSLTVSDGDSGGQNPSQDEMDGETSNGQIEALNETLALLNAQLAEETAADEVVLYESLDEFVAAPATVSRYEYEILQRLEFLQYSQVILIGLIFVLIFKKK